MLTTTTPPVDAAALPSAAGAHALAPSQLELRPSPYKNKKQENHSEHCVQLILQNKKQTTIETGKLGKRCCRSSKQKATEQK